MVFDFVFHLSLILLFCYFCSFSTFGLVTRNDRYMKEIMMHL